MTQPDGHEEPTEWIEQVDAPTEFFAPVTQQPTQPPHQHSQPLGPYAGPFIEQANAKEVGYEPTYPQGYGAEYAPEAYGQSYGQPYAPPPQKTTNGLYILVFSLVLILGLLLGASGFLLYAGFPNQQMQQAESTAESSVEAASDESSEQDSSSPVPPVSETEDEEDAAAAADDELEELHESTGRPVNVELPDDVQPANLFARTGYKNGLLFNLYVSGSATEEFALLVQTEYRVKFPGFYPPRGEHYLTVEDRASGEEIRVTCNDNGRYVLCTTAYGQNVYIV